MMSKAFHEGIERVIALGSMRRTAIMCAEVLWWRCHRALIADYLKAGGHTVLHISGSGKAEEHPFTSAARILNGKLSYGTAESALEFTF